MRNDLAIKVINLKKVYKLYESHLDRAKEVFIPFGKKYHRNFTALDSINFEIKKGESVGIIGRNGSGKSTLLKLITSVVTPTEGEVVINGKISAILELAAGFNPEMSGIENIFLNGSINGMTNKEIKEKMDEIIDFAELRSFINQPMKTYSSGMTARLAFSLSVVNSPDILIVDEALSVGDAAFRRKCFAKMEEIRKSGATILFVSHSESSIISLCNRVIWLNYGEYVLDGDSKLVMNLYMKNSNSKNLKIDEVRDEYKLLTSDSNVDTKISKKREYTEEFYDESLVSKSLLSYNNHGAKITDISIKTLNDKRVNILSYGKKYKISYIIDIEDSVEEAQFVCLIKNQNGIGLGGGRYPNQNGHMQIKHNKNKVEFNFTCRLCDGDYFINVGALGLYDDTYDFLHRVTDAYMFKVINADNFISGDVGLVEDIEVKGLEK